jgi:hypothetical protein
VERIYTKRQHHYRVHIFHFPCSIGYQANTLIVGWVFAAKLFGQKYHGTAKQKPTADVMRQEEKNEIIEAYLHANGKHIYVDKYKGCIENRFNVNI